MKVAVNADLFLFAGVLTNEVNLEQADCDLDERVYWFCSFPVYFVP